MNKGQKEVNTNIVKIIKRKAKEIGGEKDKHPEVTSEDVKELASCVRLLALTVLSLYNDIKPQEDMKNKKNNDKSIVNTTDFKEAAEDLRKIAKQKAIKNETVSENPNEMSEGNEQKV